ncbi:MAG: zf-HC2 domain-containing protein [Vicinamibacterales bacterium]|jgi:anti-sigma factor RsiW|nr:zf-HC2 domain-containing protein [Vicinamibacterales bacterium]
MECTEFNDRLDALLDGTLPDRDRERAEAHAAACPRCCELHTLMRVDLADAPVETPGDLTESILARTSGPPCERAEAQLGDHVDGMLDGLDRELLDAHLSECADCATLATALTRLGDDLPAFAELHPDATLVEEVLARTRPRPTRWAAGWDRIQSTSRHLVERPRIAWEAGYAAAMVVWLVFGATWSPLRVAPVQALAIIQQGAVETQAAGTSAMAALSQRVASMSERAIGAASNGANNLTGSVIAGLSSRYQRAADAAPDLGRHWRQLAAAVADRDLFGGVAALRSLSRDAGAMLNRFLFSPATTTASRSLPEQRSRP